MVERQKGERRHMKLIMEFLVGWAIDTCLPSVLAFFGITVSPFLGMVISFVLALLLGKLVSILVRKARAKYQQSQSRDI